jgi:hypothetical protein
MHKKMRGGGWFDGPMSYFRSIFSRTPSPEVVASNPEPEQKLEEVEPEEAPEEAPEKAPEVKAIGGKKRKTRRNKGKNALKK